MRSYSFGIEAHADGIQYAELDYKNFIAREVLRENKPVGIYHIKIKDNISLANSAYCFQRNFTDCEVGLLDPDGILKLEYAIYIIVKSIMVQNNILEIFEQVDCEINNTKE
jgi:hypothetical protein